MHRVLAGKHGTTARNQTDYGDVVIAQSMMCSLEQRRTRSSGNQTQERDDKSVLFNHDETNIYNNNKIQNMINYG